LAVGCKHTQPQAPVEQCSDCTTTLAPAQPRLALVPTPQPSAPAGSLPLVNNPAPLAVTPAPTRALPNNLPPVAAEPVAPVPTVNPEQSAPPKSPWVMPNTESSTPAPAPTTIPAPVTMSSMVPQPAVARKPVPTMSTTAPTVPVPTVAASSPSAAAQYYNSPDYSILFGVLDYNARRGTWRLRYADAGDEDRYGGSVTLDGIGRQMDGFSGGDYVRVEGGFVNPESTEPSPAYRVKEMRPATGGK
jgi:hypothetical protein